MMRAHQMLDCCIRGSGIVILAAWFATAGCGNGVTSPSSVNPPLADGAFMLSISGGTRECQDLKNPQAGTSITLTLTATHDASGAWVARGASAADGDVHMRLFRSDRVPPNPLSGPIGPFDTAVSGILSGLANDTYMHMPNWILSGTSATFGTVATISGVIRTPGRYGDGRIEAPVTFSRNGVSSICPANEAAWSLNGPL